MKHRKHTLIASSLFIVSLAIFFLTSGGNTPYDYFSRLAHAFLNQKYWLENPPPWLNELVPGPLGRFFTVYPPMPAILLMPFTLLFGTGFQQQFLSHILGAGIVTLAYTLTYKITAKTSLALYLAILTGFGTIIWFLASNGSAWYLGQISAAFFIFAALVETHSKRRPFFAGLFLASAYLSRLQTILLLPLFIALLSPKLKRPHALILFLLPIVSFIILNAAYNFLRFSTFWDKAYILIPGVLEEPWYSRGLFHPFYIPRHLKTLFLSYPKIITGFPYLIPSWGGLSIWITTPVFIYLYKASLKNRFVLISWLSILLISIPILTHGTTGFAQFGYRFAVDFYPILIFLLAKGLSASRLRWHHLLLLVLSILVNLWGVLWINKFGWVGY